MPRLPLAPPPGIFRGATPSASAGRWWDCNNIRFRQGQAQPIGGHVMQPNTYVAYTVPRDLITWHDNKAIRWAAFGTDSKLYAYRFDTKTIYDITPAGVGGLEPPGARVGYGLADYGEDAFGTARDPKDIGVQDIAASMGDMWSMDTFGEDLLVVPTQDGRLYRWSPTVLGLCAVVPEAPINNRGVVVTDQRHVVLLASGGDPRKIAWSDQENYHVWTPDVANLAGDKQLQTQSYAMRAIKVGQGILIWTANDLHLMQYVGPPYAYGINMIGAGCGPMSSRCMVQIGNNVIWPGMQSFWSYSGSVSPMPSDIQDWFFSLVNREQVGRVFGGPNPAFSEAWWDWPDEGSIECNRYIAVNYGDPQRPWTIGVRNRTCADPTGTMDYPVLGGPIYDGGCLYLHEYGWTDNGLPRAGTGQVYLESGSIMLGEGDHRYHVRQIALDAAVAGPTQIEQVLGWRFFHREHMEDPTEYDTGVYTETHAGLMDIRFSGRVTRVRVEALTDEVWSIGRPRIIIRQGGRR